MRIKSVCLVFLLAAIPVATISALLSSELIPQPDQQTNEVEHRLEVAANELSFAKESWSLLANEDPPPEITAVVIPPRPYPPAQVTTPAAVAGSAQLVRQVQNELKRLGCYDHEINGEWTPATRSAMKDFLDRANAVLPSGVLGAAHLALLKGQSEPICGTNCPAGQSLAKDGRCLPSALFSLATKHAASARTTPGSEASNTVTDVTVSPTPPVRVPRVRPPPPPRYGSGFFGLFGF